MNASKKIDLKKFKHKISIEVRYDDLDTMGHVNNKVYLAYFEEARISYISDILNFDKRSLDFKAVVAHISIDYFKAIFFGDKIEIYSRCSRIGTKSFDFQTIIIKKVNSNSDEKELVSKSIVTLVSINPKTGETVENAPEEMQKIKEFEGFE